MRVPLDPRHVEETVFDALISAREKFGDKEILEDLDRKPLTYTGRGVLDSYDSRRVDNINIKVGDVLLICLANEVTDKPMVGQNLAAHLDALRLAMRKAAENLEFEEAARLRDEIKRMKLMDLEFANEALTAPGEEVDKSAPKRWRADAAAEKAEAFRKGR